MSHELRTPLNAIIGFSEVLRDGLVGELNDKQRTFISDIFSSGHHLLSLINDILDLSKVEAGMMVLDLEPVHVSSSFASCLSIIREKAAARHIRLAAEVPESLGAIQADGRKLKQIVYNLLSNAVKFTEGGNVTLSGCVVDRAEVGKIDGEWACRSLPLADNDFAKFLKISVTDTGMGMTPGGLAQLFRPFTQIDSGLSRKFEGTGLGLAMVKSLAELHGGTVAVASAVNVGTCFTAWVPVRAVQPAATASRGRRLDPLAGAPTALVVEDDPKSAELIRVQLVAEGFKVVHAASAEAALELAARQPPALITLDISLPAMDGWEFLSRITQMPVLAAIPVVIISIIADEAKGFALGAAAVVQKPLSRPQLYDALVEIGLLPHKKATALRVLVVDDDPRAVELVALRLDAIGAAVLRAHGGKEAIEIARRELPDLIILDLMMPGVNGFEVVSALKTGDTMHVPILVLTAKQVTAADRVRLNGYVTAIVEKGHFNSAFLTSEVRRATSIRSVAAGLEG